MNDASENDLLQQIALGHESAFRELVNRYADILHTYLFKLTGSKVITEELVQDIFVKIWLSRETLGRVRNIRNYLLVLARNDAFNVLRKIARENLKKEKWEYLNSSGTFREEGENYELHLNLIEEAIHQLPAQQQKVWILSRREGKKYNEIAGEMNLSRETVKKYLQYATAAITDHVVKRLDTLLLLYVFREF